MRQNQPMTAVRCKVTLTGRLPFAGILGIHIDYAARSKDGSHSDILDSIDFRKGPDGSFAHHTT
jgi:hypothetical protein